MIDIFSKLYGAQNVLNDNKRYDDLQFLLNQLPVAITITDLDSKYIMLNQLTATLQNLNLKNSRGLTYNDMQCEAAECADIYMEQDRKALNAKKEIKSLGFQKFKNTNEWVILFGSKKNLSTIDGLVVGTISCFSEITEFVLPQDIKDILIKPMKDKKKQFSIEIDNCYEKLNLPERQSEVFFFFLRRKSSREIGEILGLSHRTIEFYIDNIKNKLGCSNKTELIEKGMAAGYLGILPETLLSQLYKK